MDSIVKHKLIPCFLTAKMRRRLGWGRAPQLASVACVKDAEMTELNRTFRNKNKPTDVLSFPFGQFNELGDIKIDTDFLNRRYPAGKREDAAVRMAVHGLAHLLGFTHDGDDDYRQMRRMEWLLLGRRLRYLL